MNKSAVAGKIDFAFPLKQYLIGSSELEVLKI